MKKQSTSKTTKAAKPKTTAKSKAADAKSGASKASHTTVDHDEIREWVEARGGSPATVKKTESGSDAGILRIEFPGGDDDALEQIDWEEWFEKFDSNKLAFLYQEKTAAGITSRFNKLVSRETAATGKAH